MSVISVTRKFEFDAGHRVLGHGGKCRFLHGHRYCAEVCVRLRRDGLDALDMVVDFAEIKEKIGKWIDENWDHNLLLNSKDPFFNFGGAYVQESITGGREPYVFNHENPTAEVMAHVLLGVAKRLLPNLEICFVRLWETPNCHATVVNSPA